MPSRPGHFFFLAAFFLTGFAAAFVVLAFLSANAPSQFSVYLLLGPERTIGPDIVLVPPTSLKQHEGQVSNLPRTAYGPVLPCGGGRGPRQE